MYDKRAYTREWNRRYYRENTEAERERVYSRYRVLRDALRLYKEAEPCKDCGNKFPHYVMEFDHLEPGQGKVIASMTGKVSMERLFEELDKCDLVCANCHAVRTWNRRC